MLVYVRARKDEKALKHLLKKEYPDIEIRSLGGIRKEELRYAITEIIKNPKDFTIILLGKEDKKWIDDMSTGSVKIHFVPKSKVRNVKRNLLIREFETVKSRFILDIHYNDGYILGSSPTIIPEFIPGTDVFQVFWPEYNEVLEKIGINVRNPLIWHVRDVDYIFYKDKIIGKILRPLHGEMKVEIFEDGSELDFKSTVRRNIEYIKEKAGITMKKIQRVVNMLDLEKIVVPWSGGKDSTVILLLLKDLGLEFDAIFIDTGLEFEETYEYLDYVSKKLKIKPLIIDANIKENYEKFGYEYLIKRKCTMQKIRTLYNYIQKHYENPLLINGDRISESLSRSKRPELRKDQFFILSPIKYWSYLDEEIYFYLKGIDFNRLYKKGFYRVGCFVCPFIDSFERIIF